MKEFSEVISLLANIFTLITSSIFLYLFIKKGPAIAAALRLLLNFSFQTTLGELREKLERLNEYHAGDPDGNKEIVNIFHELHGQICGNPRLLTAMPDVAEKLEKMLKSSRGITEPRKRAMVSELREILKNLNVDNFENFFGDGQ
ncbi:hypothetical protein ACXZ1M_03740 [Duganella sp. PWIR1]